MKIYIAGKITGDPNYKEKFAKAAEIIKAEGNVPINPANNHEGLTPKAYMRISFDLIDDSDEVRFLPDYKDSPGALIELSYCRYTGKPHLFFEREVLSGTKREYNIQPSVDSVLICFAERLKALRISAKLSQDQLGTALGMSRGSISFYENCDRTPDIVLLNRAARYFGVSECFLLGYTGED